VLKSGHHGSRTSSSRALLDAIDAEIAVVSVGAGNRYGHPAAQTLAALAAHGCRVLRTDQGGAVRFELRGRTLWLERPGRPPEPLQFDTGPPALAAAGGER
jgi:competence protein ComEC